jgi:tRNA(fMet)-specific endonuclease VapC
MSYMLDTTVCIDVMRGRPGKVADRLRSLAPKEIIISSITLSELWFGASRSARRAYNEILILNFCLPFQIASFDALAAQVYGSTRAALERAGAPIGPLDVLIAAHALALGATIVTSNVREFRRVAGLTVEDWRAL